jgi:hypothetical protein
MHTAITLDPSLRDEESASCHVKRPEPRVLNFCRLRDEPTREDILVTSLALSLRGMVKHGSISQAEADRQLDDYKLRLWRDPLSPDLQVFMNARLDRDEIIRANPILDYCRDYCRSHGLELRREGREWVCSCPLHEERTPSFKINPEKQLFHCHGCGAGGSVIDLHAALKGITIGEAMRQLAGKGASEARREVAVYDYQDAAGKVVFQIVRYSDKTFRARQRVNGRWVWNIEGVEPVPYRLPELLAGPASVWVVEGEKDVETLREIRQTATCNPFGAGKWKSQYSEHLRGLHVWLVPDNDEKGRGHAREVFASLDGVAACVRWLDLPAKFNDKQIKDISDLRAACVSEEAFFEALAELQQKAKTTTPPPEESQQSRDDDDEASPPSPPRREAPKKPKLSPEAFYGILGEITRFIMPESEADPAAIYSQLLAAFGNAIGRKAFFQVEQTKHFTNLFLNLVGRTSKGRKGTALDHIKALFAQADPLYSTQFVKGLSTVRGADLGGPRSCPQN